MRRLILVLAIALLAWSEGWASEPGLLKKTSSFSVQETVQRLEEAIEARGMKLFPRIDHSAAAQEYGKSMGEAVVISFGNPAYGTKFMLETPESGIDFPPRAIVYQDQDGTVWLAYNSAGYLYETIFKRHGLVYPEADVDFYRTVLEELTDHAIGKDAS